ncbi:MAG: hypothetical protein R2941_10770 [Desulfobacterales bacterium]
MKSIYYYISGCLIITIAGGFGMLGVSTADVHLCEPFLSMALIAEKHSGTIHSVIAFSFAGTLLAAGISLFCHHLRKRKKNLSS